MAAVTDAGCYVRKRLLCVPHLAIADVRVHDKLYQQAQAAAREVHDEQRAGELHNPAGTYCLLFFFHTQWVNFLRTRKEFYNPTSVLFSNCLLFRSSHTSRRRCSASLSYLKYRRVNMVLNITFIVLSEISCVACSSSCGSIGSVVQLSSRLTFTDVVVGIH